jgi:WD40 repeat protein
LVYSLPQTSPDSVKLGKAVDVAWSPEGNWLVALDKGEVRIWDVNANNVRTVKISESGDRLVVSAKANYAVLAASTQTGYTAKVLNLNTGTVVSNDTLQIGGIGAIIMAGWHPTEPVLAYTATENQAADLVMIDVNENGLKSNTIKPDFGLSYRFVRWLRNEAIVAKLDLKSPAERAVKDVVKVSRSANLVTLKNSELGVELDNNTLRLIPPSVVPEDDKRGLRLTYASNLRFAAFSAYSSKTKSNQIFILGIYSSNLGDIQPFGAGTVAAWQSRVPNE